jgi:hypothetical protein
MISMSYDVKTPEHRAGSSAPRSAPAPGKRAPTDRLPPSAGLSSGSTADAEPFYPMPDMAQDADAAAQRVSFADSLVGPTDEDPNTPVTRGELAELRDKGKLIEECSWMTLHAYDRMVDGVRNALPHLEKRQVKKPDLLHTMVNMAASAAIAGGANIIAQLAARRLSQGVAEGFAKYKQRHEWFSTDAIKEHLKKSFKVGSAVSWNVVGDELAANFAEVQINKIRHAQIDYKHWVMGDDTLDALPIEVLRDLADYAKSFAADDEISDLAARNTAVEWTNLIARLRHGAGDWDSWAGEHGSERAIPTKQAAPHPVAGEKEHPSNSNVASDTDHMRDLVDNDQHTMQPDAPGILEIAIWVNGRGEPKHLFDHPGLGMRLDGVSGYAKSRIAEFSTVGDVKMNKIVTIYADLTLRPPKPSSRFLITADGYIRAWTTADDQLAAVAAFAQSLSPRRIT